MSITRTAVAAGVPSGFPFSLAAAANGICFLSGMPALDTDGTVAAGTFQEETDRAWRNTAAIAEAAGYSVEEIVFVQCVLAAGQGPPPPLAEQCEPLDRLVAKHKADVTVSDLAAPATHRSGGDLLG